MPINLLSSLQQASRNTYENSEFLDQFRQIRDELEFYLDDDLHVLSYDVEHPVFDTEKVQFSNEELDEVVYLSIKYTDGVSYKIRLIDKVILENMARFVQYIYLSSSNNDTQYLDEYNDLCSEFGYRCIFYLIGNKLMIKKEEQYKWTVTLCTIALLCRNPGSAIQHIYELLPESENSDLVSFLDILALDSWFESEFNNPPIQDILGDIAKLAVNVSSKERLLIIEYIDHLVAIANSLRRNFTFFADNYNGVSTLHTWINSFGCPPIQFCDGIEIHPFGIQNSGSLHEYFTLMYKLLSPSP